ncbi:hypothetical protein KR222_011267 [Zaprionus bogoriensis]|nr:hypothetical protein KR222_011267 [Zaprionus bogoriensis]
MQLDCSWTLSLSLSLALTLSCLELVMPMPTATAATTMRPKLVMHSGEEPVPMMYHFIVDHRPTSLGQNYYIKPGQLVGTFTLDSGMLHVNHEDSKRTLSSKLNILFVTDAKGDEAPTKIKSSE